MDTKYLDIIKAPVITEKKWSYSTKWKICFQS